MNGTRIIRGDNDPGGHLLTTVARRKYFGDGISLAEESAVLSEMESLAVEHSIMSGIAGIDSEAVSPSVVPTDLFTRFEQVWDADMAASTDAALGYEMPYSHSSLLLNLEHVMAVRAVIYGRGGEIKPFAVGNSFIFLPITTINYAPGSASVSDTGRARLLRTIALHTGNYDFSWSSPTLLYEKGTATAAIPLMSEVYDTGVEIQNRAQRYAIANPAASGSCASLLRSHNDWRSNHDMYPLPGTGGYRNPTTAAQRDAAYYNNSGTPAMRFLTPNGAASDQYDEFKNAARAYVAFDGSQANLSNQGIKSFEMTPSGVFTETTQGFYDAAWPNPNGYIDAARRFVKTKCEASIPLTTTGGGESEICSYQMYEAVFPQWAYAEPHLAMMTSGGVQYTHIPASGVPAGQTALPWHLPYAKAVDALKFTSRHGWLANVSILGAKHASPIFVSAAADIQYSYNNLPGTGLSMDHDEFVEFILQPMLDPVTASEAAEFGLAEGVRYTPNAITYWDASHGLIRAMFGNPAGDPVTNFDSTSHSYFVRKNIEARMARSGVTPSGLGLTQPYGPSGYVDLTAVRSSGWGSADAKRWYEEVCRWLTAWQLERFRQIQKACARSRINGGAKQTSLASIRDGIATPSSGDGGPVIGSP